MWEFAAPIVGGLLGAMGGSGSGSSQSSTQTLDPRMAAAIYGGQGIVPTMSNWYTKNNSGLNQQMVNGLNQQYQVLNDPFTQAGYNQMGQNGMAMMQGGVAGNPFTSGFGAPMGRSGGSQMPSGASPMGWGSLGLAGAQAGGPFTLPAAYVAPPAAPANPFQNVVNQFGQGHSGGMGRDPGMGGYGYDSAGAISNNLGRDDGGWGGGSGGWGTGPGSDSNGGFGGGWT